MWANIISAIIKLALRSNIDLCVCVCVSIVFHFPPRDNGFDNKLEGGQLIVSLCYWPLLLKFLLAHQTGIFTVPLNISCLKNILRALFKGVFHCLEDPWLYVLEKSDTNNKQEKCPPKRPPYRAHLELQICSLTPLFLLPFWKCLNYTFMDGKLFVLQEGRNYDMLDFCWRVIADVITWKIFWHLVWKKSGLLFQIILS